MTIEPTKSGNKTANIYVKNRSLYTVLMATDQKPQKLQKGTINHTNIV